MPQNQHHCSDRCCYCHQSQLLPSGPIRELKGWKEPSPVPALVELYLQRANICMKVVREKLADSTIQPSVLLSACL
jgi:hypothetical protein